MEPLFKTSHFPGSKTDTQIIMYKGTEYVQTQLLSISVLSDKTKGISTKTKGKNL